MSHIIFPSENAVGSFGGTGDAYQSRILRELSMAKYLKVCSSSIQDRFVHSGLIVTENTDLNIKFTSGIAVIDGYVCETEGTEYLNSLPNNNQSFIYMQLTKTDGLVTGFTFVSNTSGITPTDAVVISRVNTADGDIGPITNAKRGPYTGSYTGDGDEKEIFLGWSPRIVIISCINTGGEPDVPVFVISGTNTGLDEAGLNATSIATLAMVGSHNYYPEITNLGFKVDGTDTGMLSVSGADYHYVVFP